MSSHIRARSVCVNVQIYIACLFEKTGYEVRSKSTEFGGNRNDVVKVRVRARAHVSTAVYA